MNEFERKIREAMASARYGTQAIKNQINHHSSTLAGSYSSRLKNDDEMVEPPQPDTTSDLLSPIEKSSPNSYTLNRSAMSKPGLLSGSWDNLYIEAAIPVLMLVERVSGGDKTFSLLRSQFARELHQFQQTLYQKNVPLQDVNKLAYSLSTYIDECCINDVLSNSNSQSLTVEFYGDAFGGEKTFDHLQQYMIESHKHIEIIAFYDLLLSLGFKGKFSMIDRGAILLADLRHELDILLYNHNPSQSLSDAVHDKVVLKRRRITPMKVLCYGLILSLIVYGGFSWYLHEQSKAIRSEILAWTPPMPRKINIMETLPQPLPQILSEGWLEVRPDPRGWLLIFTSDGAFATGKSQLSNEFLQKRNIERLGDALNPWPGDLEIIGHTDSKPFRGNTGNSNLKLSEARAEVVAGKLTEAMANSKYQRSITHIGKGEAEPLDDRETEEAYRRNRRVDILWKIGQRNLEASGITATQDGNFDDAR